MPVRVFPIVFPVLMLIAPFVPLASAGPVEDATADASAGVASATDDATYAYRTAAPIALGAYTAGATAGMQAYGGGVGAAESAYASGIAWGLGAYGAAVDTTTSGYGAAVAYAEDGYGVGVKDAQSTYAAGENTGIAGYDAGVNVTRRGYSYAANVASGAYSSATVLTGSAYAYAVDATLIVYPRGVATFGEIARDLGLDTSTTYGLVFNPIALIDYLQRYDQFQGTVTVLSPTPYDVALQAALHPLGHTLSAPTPAHGTLDAPSLEPQPVSACAWDSADYSTKRAWFADRIRAPETFEIGEEGWQVSRLLQVSAMPFGNDCHQESNVWYSTFGVRDAPHQRRLTGVQDSLGIYLNYTGSVFDAHNPMTGRTVRESYGFGDGDATPTGANWGMVNPALFLERTAEIKPQPDVIHHVELAGGQLASYDCHVACKAPGLAGSILLFSAKVTASPGLSWLGAFSGIVGAIAWTVVYLASEYHELTDMSGVPGGGVQFETGKSATSGKTVHA